MVITHIDPLKYNYIIIVITVVFIQLLLLQLSTVKHENRLTSKTAFTTYLQFIIVIIICIIIKNSLNNSAIIIR